MRLEGSVIREGKFWIAEIPILEAITQGTSHKGALEMIVDWLEVMVDRKGFRAEVFSRYRECSRSA